MISLLLTLVCGLFFLIGIVVYKYSKNKNSLTLISIASACIVILGLITSDLVPELMEIGKLWLILFILLGLIILIILDSFVPHHTHHHHENDELSTDHKEHIVHIGVITIIALLLHNLMEGMALYSVSINNIKSGILMCIGISLHNLPFGFQIASFNEKDNHKILISLLVLSGFLGGLIVFFFGGVSKLLEGIIIAITLGMLVHIFLFELLSEVVNNIKKKETLYGIIIGIVILILIRII